MSDMERGPRGVEDVTQHQRQGIPHHQQHNTSYLESTDKQKRTDRNAAASTNLVIRCVKHTRDVLDQSFKHFLSQFAEPRARTPGYYAHA